MQSSVWSIDSFDCVQKILLSIIWKRNAEETRRTKRLRKTSSLAIAAYMVFFLWSSNSNSASDHRYFIWVDQLGILIVEITIYKFAAGTCTLFQWTSIKIQVWSFFLMISRTRIWREYSTNLLYLNGCAIFSVIVGSVCLSSHIRIISNSLA